MSAILFSQDEIELPMSCGTSNVQQQNTAQSFAGSAGIFNGEIVIESCTDAVDVCEELLSSKIANLDLNEVPIETTHAIAESAGGGGGGGSDSGVDVATNVSVNVVQASVTLQRALSSNSGGYTSSNNGLDEPNTTSGLNRSCDSSVISYCSDFAESKLNNATAGNVETCSIIIDKCTSNGHQSNGKYEYYSENGSESSSVTGCTNTPRGSSVRRKVAMFEPHTPTGGSGTPNSKSTMRQREFKTPTPMTTSQMSHIRPRLSNLKRTASLPRATPQLRDTKQLSVANERTAAGSSSPFRVSTPSRGTVKQPPDSLPSSLSRTQSMSMQRLVQRTPSLSRARTPGTPSDDGRWPSVGGSSRSVSGKRGLSMTPDLATLKTRTSMLASMEVRPGGVNPYSTLPRRRKQKSVEDLTSHNSRSNSISRDTRMTSSVMLSSRRSLVSAYSGSGGAATPTHGKMLPPNTQHTHMTPKSTTSAAGRRLQQTKTRIYHETSVQTALTCEDLEKVFAGGCNASRPVDAAELRDQQTQADIRDAKERELERLRDEVRQLTQREHDLGSKLQREREEKLAMQQELHLNMERVIGMLELARMASGGDGGSGTPNSEDSGGGGSGGHDSLLMLESQIQMSGHELIERQQEIGQLRQLCRTLQLELERSLAAQECLLHEKAVIEQESNELQDFLQHEKSAMCDALKELETEYQTCKQQLASRDEEVKVLRDECRHLVRLNEQRRQENRLLQTKYAALDTKSKELVAQQNSSVSGASVALSGLHIRLDSLVEQLVTSYNISEQDLEDIGFQSDTQTHSGSGGTGDETTAHDFDGSSNNTMRLSINGYEGSSSSMSHAHTLSHSHAQLPPPLLPQSSDGSLSPQRNQSFIAAVISAIRHATTPAGKRLLSRNNSKRAGDVHESNNNNNNNNQNNHSNGNHNHTERANNGDDSDSTEMLDSETEPCLMMDNVLEDVTMPDSHSHNMVSSCTGMISQIELPSELVNATTGDESLHNLSQAITNRQQMELQVCAMNVQRTGGLPLNGQHYHENSISEDVSCHDSVAEIPSLMEYCCATQAVVDQVIDVDALVTKLLKVLRLIQMDNDNCIQQLIVDKNKLQQNKEDMLEKLKDLEDVNIKLQDELMDATQELMLKSSDLTNAKAEMQRHRNEIDRLTEDICNLSTLCSNYRKLSPTAEFPPLLSPDVMPTLDQQGNDEVLGIMNLLKMWHTEGQLKDQRVRSFLSRLLPQKQSSTQAKGCSERERIYANQLENILTILIEYNELELTYPALQQLRKDIEIVKLNANWEHFLMENNTQPDETITNSVNDENANAEIVTTTTTTTTTTLTSEFSMMEAN